MASEPKLLDSMTRLMSKVEQIEDEIRRLSPEDLATLRNWFREYDAAAWDSELEADIRSGKLDGLGDAALEAHRKGQTREL